MKTAIYIVSPSDAVNEFAAKAKSIEYSGMNVLRCNPEDDVMSLVFLIGSPKGLKNKIEKNKDWKEEWISFRSKVNDILKAIHVDVEELHLFVHFGGQIEDEAMTFNKKLGESAVIEENTNCYAISFGNKYPTELFPNGVFSPLGGKKFSIMCQTLRDGKISDFEYLRSLRLSMVCAYFDDDNKIDFSSICRQINSFFGVWFVDDAISSREKNFIYEEPLLKKIFHLSDKNDFITSAWDRISQQDYNQLLKILKREEN